MSGVRFRRDSDEEICPLTVMGPATDPRGLFLFVCMRAVGHAPPCISRTIDACAADGRCWDCLAPLAGAAGRDCPHADRHLYPFDL